METGFDGTETNVGKIAIGLYNGMYAFGGWTNLNMVAGEIKNPKRFMNSYFVIFVSILCSVPREPKVDRIPFSFLLKFY